MLNYYMLEYNNSIIVQGKSFLKVLSYRHFMKYRDWCYKIFSFILPLLWTLTKKKKLQKTLATFQLIFIQEDAPKRVFLSTLVMWRLFWFSYLVKGHSPTQCYLPYDEIRWCHLKNIPFPVLSTFQNFILSLLIFSLHIE